MLRPDKRKSIGNYAFSTSGLTGITIPDSVTSIGGRAFSSCSSLSNVVLSKNLTRLESGVFSDCPALKSIAIPDGVTYIGLHAFSECGLTSITIPSSVTYIDSWAFVNSTKLSSITLSDSVRRLGNNAFYNTAYFNNNTNWENGVLYIGKCLASAKLSIPNSYAIKGGTICIAESAFSACSNLSSISIPDSVISIGNRAFFDTAYYLNVSNWSNGVLYIGKYLIKADYELSGSYSIKSGTVCIADYAFDWCRYMTGINIPASVKCIGNSAFSECYALTTVVIPSGVTTIGSSAFSLCLKLNKIVIPASVVSIGDYAFNGSDAVTIYAPDGSAAQEYAAENETPYLPVVAVTGVKLSNTVSDLVKGKAVTFKATVSPAGATDKTVTWTTSNSSIATVNATTGKVTAKAPGTVTIAATAGGVKARHTFTVHSYVSMRLSYSKAIQNGVKGTIDSAGTKPLLISGKTMLPLRFVSEKLGATVTYVSDKKPITVKLGSVTVKFTLGSKKMTVTKGGKTTTKTLDVAAQIKNKKTYIPLRAIGEALAFDVYYDAATKIIIVNSPKMSDSIKATRLNEAKGYIK